MKNLFKRTFILALMVFIGATLWYQFEKYHNSSVSREFYSLIKDSNQEVLDLRNIQSIDWDELVIWTPYANICDYGIRGYEKAGLNCVSSTDDGECYLLFLKSNKLLGKVAVNRKMIDLASSDIKGRVPRLKARFTYKSKGDWPKVALY